MNKNDVLDKFNLEHVEESSKELNSTSIMRNVDQFIRDNYPPENDKADQREIDYMDMTDKITLLFQRYLNTHYK